MKRSLVVLFIGLILSVIAGANTPGEKTDLKPGIVFGMNYDATIDGAVFPQGDHFQRVFIVAPVGIITWVDMESDTQFTNQFTEADSAFNKQGTTKLINEADLFSDCKKFLLHNDSGFKGSFNDAYMAINYGCYGCNKHDRSWCHGNKPLTGLSERFNMRYLFDISGRTTQNKFI